MEEEITKLLNIVQNKLTLEGRKRVFEEGKELKSGDLLEWLDPEEFTRQYLIDVILYDFLKLENTGPKNFKTTDGTRKVDYAVKHEKSQMLIEAKPINADLYDKSSDGAINQIKGIFRLAEAKDKYDFGVATNGLKWVFISSESQIIAELGLSSNFNQIESYMKIRKHIPKRKREDIGKEFYKKYNDILHGTDKISEKDCFVNSISNVDDVEDREEIAQLTINRLIFIKFLHERGLMKSIKRDWDIFEFIKQLPPYEVNAKLQELFFNVMNRQKKDRSSLLDVDPIFYDIPYLNGSLFVKNEVEQKNTEYLIDAKILKETIKFLDGFKFMSVEELKPGEDAIDPEILGYIFERTMTATDRKGTGAYYTPKEITEYIAKNTIYPVILDKANNFLMKEKCYKSTESLNKIDDLFLLPATTLNEIYNKIILNLTICDNACGSGAFLLAAANVLFKLDRKIDDKLGLNNSDISLKKLVFKSLYGVDINSRGIEITLLRLWLWLAESYNPEHIEPLPNIEYNLRAGNSLIGYVDIEQFGTTKLNLDDFENADETTNLLLNRFRKIKTEYRKSIGDDARKLRNEIEEIRDKINKKLDTEIHRELNRKKIQMDKEHFLGMKPFHWGFEFYEDFNLDLPKEERGFDIIIGNPPYVKEFTNREIFHDVKNCSPSVKQYYEGKMDYLYFFIELGLDLLKKEGRISFITTNYWLQAKGAKILREKILKESVIESIFNFNEFTVFEGTGQHNLIFFLKKKEANKETKNKIEVSIVQDKKMDKDELIGYFREEKSHNIKSFKSKPQNEFFTDKNYELTFLSKDTESICQKIMVQQNYKLTEKDVATGIDVHQDKVIKSHLKKLPDLTIGDGIFQISKKELDNLNLSKEEKDIIKPFFTTNELKRYYANKENNEWIIYTTTDLIKKINKYPKIKTHLDKYKQIITSDFGPYGLHRAREERFFLGEKIISLRKTKQPSFSYVDFPSYVSLTFFVIQPKDINLKYLTGILNSKLIHFWLFYKGKREGNQLQIDKAPILSIPIKKVSDEQQKPLIDLVEKMIALNGDKSSEEKLQDIDDKINDYVYKLYGFTDEEEIAIINESLET